MIWPVDGPPAGPCHPEAFETLRLPARAGDGNRTRMTSLEGIGYGSAGQRKRRSGGVPDCL
jgi:hypothetical protein